MVQSSNDQVLDLAAEIMKTAIQTQAEIGNKVRNGVDPQPEVTEWCQKTIDLLQNQLQKSDKYPGVDQPQETTQCFESSSKNLRQKLISIVNEQVDKIEFSREALDKQYQDCVAQMSNINQLTQEKQTTLAKIFKQVDQQQTIDQQIIVQLEKSFKVESNQMSIKSITMTDMFVSQSITLAAVWPSEENIKAMTVQQLAQFRITECSWVISNLMHYLSFKSSDGSESDKYGNTGCTPTVQQITKKIQTVKLYKDGSHLIGMELYDENNNLIAGKKGTRVVTEEKTIEIKSNQNIVGIQVSHKPASHIAGLAFRIAEWNQ